MKINRIDIQAFRSLYDVSLSLGDFSALVGANNSGKTNLADALQFLGEVARHGLEVAISRKGGFENVAFRRQRRTKRPLHFAVYMSIDGEELVNYQRQPIDRGRFDVYYEFSIRASSESREADYAVAEERFQVTRVRPRSRRVMVRIERVGDDVTFHWPSDAKLPQAIGNLLDPLSDEFFVNYLRERVSSADLMIDQLTFSLLARQAFSQLSSTRLYQLSPVESRKSGSLTPNPELDQHGGNLPAVVRYMQKNQPQSWKLTLDAMRRIVPGLSSIETDFTHDRRLALQFQEQGAGRPWSSAEVSDGTIQSLALFTALFDRRAPLVLIEEPENSVHPWIVRTFVDACRQVPDKRVLVTTHSPALIGYLKPDELTVVWRRDGRTQIRPLTELDPEALALWESGEVNTFDIVDRGFVRETVPEGLA